MATNTGMDEDEEFVTLRCMEDDVEGDAEDVISISTADIYRWDLTSILTHRIVQIKANRNRIIQMSSYFSGLLSGSFSESCLDLVSIHWNAQSFFSVLRFMFGYYVEITSDNFILLYEAALFFGVESLLLQCQLWLSEVTSSKDPLTPKLQVDALIRVWNYGVEHANDLILHLCTSYLARNLIRCNCLPLWFLAGKRRCCFFAEFADENVDAILQLAGHPSVDVGNICADCDLSCMQIRLTEFTKKVDLSGCPQIRPILLLSLLPPLYSRDIMERKKFKRPLLNLQYLNVDHLPTLTFEAVEEVDISNCPMLDLEDALKCFSKSFPSLRKLRAVNYVDFGTEKLIRLLARFPLLCNIDLTVDVSPLIPAKVSVVSSQPALSPLGSREFPNDDHCPWDALLSNMSRRQLSNITRLTLQGRSDIADSDLRKITKSCASLCYLNLNGCMSVTDSGISFVILNCILLRSILACDTYFGQESISALCSGVHNLEDHVEPQAKKPLHSFASKFHTLHIGGCMGVSEASLSELLSQTLMIKSVSLRETHLVDDALDRFPGCSLEMLDISETKVSSLALAHLIHRNPGLKCLKARGCKHLSLNFMDAEGREPSNLAYSSTELHSELGKSCQLEEIAVGWGFSFFSLESLKPAIRSLRTLVVGLGGSLGHDGLRLLPAFSPLLETLMIYFQVISDSLVINIMKTLRKLQVLALCYCFGQISSLSFQISMPNLRNLKLERVAAWMTNTDLIILTQNCPNLVDLSLLGCRLLNPESQDIISCGWPGLISMHLEDCGEVTAHGVSPLMNCRALEDLLLRHTGTGIPKNFIVLMASEMPMLRKMSLDICDASDGDFDIPDFSDRCFLSYVKIARCKLQRCSLDLHKLDIHKTPVHKETLLLVWDSKKLTRAVIKERL
ncbi:BTB/POZ domain-containing protein FBL11-like isoform X2 [Coffea arabica]|uniref:BTB/POZ domain-containing protein FBL11-like isoform X2 n=1 Tax=Coffea arabica TaxID=13443 RepID=A0A6P6SRH2_COFAR|nr:BTB/POZ domain-containing protein FBL11-like isoform X2 [Coffea arabica]